MPPTRRTVLEKCLSLGAGTVASVLDLGGPLSCVAASHDTLAFTHVTVIDATGRPALADRTVLIAGDRIRKIGKSSELAVPKTARVVNAAGKYLIPGLWDMHVHARGSAALLPDNEAWLSLYVANGITGVREMGGDYPETVFRWRAEAARGERLSPRILSSGPKIEGADPRLPISLAVRDAASARVAVGKLKAMGADFIKLHSEEIPPDGFAALMDEARKQQLTVGGHLPYLTMTTREAVKSGVRFLEHATLYALSGCSKNEMEVKAECVARNQPGKRMPPAERLHRYALGFDEGLTNELAAEFVKQDVWVTPTLVVLRQMESVGRVDYSEHSQRRYLSHAFWRVWAPAERRPLFSDGDVQLLALAHEKTAAMVKMMQSAGVGLLAGTDCSVYNPFTFPGYALHQEFELLARCGLSPMEVLQTSTQNAARFLGELDQHGTVEERKVANLVLLTANPLDDIRNTRKIDSVVLLGKLLARGDLDNLAEDVARKAAAL